jgi:hypothetical protein
LIYCSYPGINSAFDADYLELKLSASTEITKGGTLSGTLFYSPGRRLHLLERRCDARLP